MIPAVTTLRQDDTHRLIPSRYSDNGVLRRLTSDEKEFDQLLQLEAGSNDRLLGEANLLPGISVHELLFGVQYAHIVNAAFTHTRPGGNRFSSGERGAWYAAFDLKTAIAEVSFHKASELREIGWNDPEPFTFDDYLSDFRADFHDLRGSSADTGWLDPSSYENSQAIARDLLASGSPGVVYSSVRQPRGVCIACFRPALVMNVRLGSTVNLEFRNQRLAPAVLPRRRKS